MTMRIETTNGSLHGWDTSMTDLFLHSMTDTELYELALTLHMPYRILLHRAAVARQRRQCQRAGIPFPGLVLRGE